MNNKHLMDYCQHYFNKSLRELTYDDIEYFFQEEKQENETLEFKSGLGEFDTVLTNNIIKVVTAFLNSSGGILIWGSPVDKEIEKGKGKICKGELVPLTVYKEKDALINKISHAISYMPIGIQIERLEKNNKYIYVFEVKESLSKPHQYDGRYLIRLDGQSKPAPHYLVDALFKQITYPDLRMDVSFKAGEQNSEYLSIIIDVKIDNNSNYINAKQVGYLITTNTGIFNVTKKQRTYFNYNGILPKGIRVGESHELFLSQKTLDRNVIIDIQFYSEHSPLKLSAYNITIDSVYKTPIVEIVVENEEAYVTMELLEKIQVEDKE